MSKTRGNVVDPWTVLDSSGADALRWYMLTVTPPGNVRRMSPDMVVEVMRNFLLTLWNTYSFFVIYANIDNFKPDKQAHRCHFRPGQVADIQPQQADYGCG